MLSCVLLSVSHRCTKIPYRSAVKYVFKRCYASVKNLYSLQYKGDQSGLAKSHKCIIWKYKYTQLNSSYKNIIILFFFFFFFDASMPKVFCLKNIIILHLKYHCISWASAKIKIGCCSYKTTSSTSINEHQINQLRFLPY